MNTAQSSHLHPFRKNWYLRSSWGSYELNGFRPAHKNPENKPFLLWYQFLLWLVSAPLPHLKTAINIFLDERGIWAITGWLTSYWIFFFLFRVLSCSPGWPCYVAQVDLMFTILTGILIMVCLGSSSFASSRIQQAPTGCKGACWRFCWRAMPISVTGGGNKQSTK